MRPAVVGLNTDQTKRWTNEWSEIFEGLAEPVIAGGFVRDSLLGRDPKDVDVFLLGGDQISGEQIAERIARFPKVDPRLEWHRSEPFLIGEVSAGGFVHQIMTTPHATIEALVDSFDWNVSQFAADCDRIIGHDVAQIIGHGKYLNLHRVSYPYSTLRRGYRFSERYEMRIRSSDIRQICKMLFVEHAEGGA